MYIRTLSLRQFRTYQRLELDLPAAPVLLLGANAQGKTSLLEAVAYLALGHSPLTSAEQHLIHWQAVKADMPYAHIAADVVHRARSVHIEIAVERKELSNGSARLEKRIRVDQHGVRRAGLAGQLNVVMFMPQDVELVGGPPAERRRHLDDVLSQIYPEYVDALATYHSALSRRNALLRHLHERGGDARQLSPLEERLAQTGVSIALYRQRAIGQLSMLADRLHQELTGGQAWLRFVYQPNFDTLRPPDLDYQMGLLSETTRETPVDVESLRQAYLGLFQRYRRQELARGATLVGPHRDELRFLSNEIDLGIYGSRGQQRSAVLALRLAEMRWLERITGESPVLLLDEVLAELDQARRRYLLELLTGMQQTILATTNAEMFPDDFRKRTCMLSVSDGIISPIT